MLSWVSCTNNIPYFCQDVIVQGLKVMQDSRYDTPEKQIKALVGSYIESNISEAEMQELVKLAYFSGSFNERGANFILEVR